MMKKVLFVFSFLISISFNAQNFTVQEDSLNLNGLSTDYDFDQNTNLDAHENVGISWEIVVDSIPSNWDYSICFPNCNPIGVTSGQLTISDGNTYFLNGHFYPNNTPGSGFITMKISDSVTTKFVSWYGTASSTSSLIEFNSLKKPILLKVTDLLGREIEPIAGELFLYIYSDGSIKKKRIID